MAIDPMPQAYDTPGGLHVRRLQPAIGAEITGLDLRQGLEPRAFADLRAALLAHGVVFLRGQDIDYQGHVAFGRMFGELTYDGSDPARPEIVPAKSQAGATNQSASRWHSDNCYMAVPPWISILRAIQVGAFGGDTCFSSSVAAYAGLSDEMKSRIAGLYYTADMAVMLRRAGDRARSFGTEEKFRQLQEKYPAVDHPVVRVHPHTGQPALYVNETHSAAIVGMDPDEGRELIRTLTDEIKRPEYQVRFSWDDHAIALWDNIAVQHYGVPNQQHDRYLERVNVVGSPCLSLQDWAERAA